MNRRDIQTITLTCYTACLRKKPELLLDALEKNSKRPHPFKIPGHEGRARYFCVELEAATVSEKRNFLRFCNIKHRSAILSENIQHRDGVVVASCCAKEGAHYGTVANVWQYCPERHSSTQAEKQWARRRQMLGFHACKDSRKRGAEVVASCLRKCL